MKKRTTLFLIVFFLFSCFVVSAEENKLKTQPPAQSKDVKSADKKVEQVSKVNETAKVEKEKRNVDADKKEIQIKLKSVAKNISKDLERVKGGAIVRVVVSSFSNNGEIAKKKEIGTLVMGELMINLSKFNNIELIEREKLAKVLDEMRLVQLGFADEKTAAQVGKMLQAQVVVVGEVNEAADKFVINARVVDVESAKVLYQEGFNSPIEGMIALSSESLVLRSKWDATYRSLILPGWGQFYNGDKIKGAAFTIVEVGLFGTAVTMHLLGANKEDEYKNKYKNTECTEDAKKCSEEVTALKQDGENYYKLRNYFIYGGAAVWVLNVLDAYLSGKDFNSALKMSQNERLWISSDGLRLSIRF